MEEATKKIVDWNGKSELLSETVTVPGMPENCTLEGLFERVINLIWFHQMGLNTLVPKSCFSDNECEFWLDQAKLLQIGGRFELSLKPEGSKDYKIVAVQSHACIAGYFENDELKKTLSNLEQIFRETQGPIICLVHGDDHVCSLRYNKNEKQWSLYDPNYPEGRAKKYNSIEEVTTEMVRILSRSIAIEVATFDKDQTLSFPSYDEKNVGNPTYALRGCGLHMISRYTSDRLPELLARAGEDMYTRGALAFALVEQDNNGWTGLHTMAMYANKYLPILLNIAKYHKLISTKLSEALPKQNKDGITGLATIIYNADNCLPGLFRLAEENIDIRRGLISALAVKSKIWEFGTVLQLIRWRTDSSFALKQLFEKHADEFPDKLKDELVKEKIITISPSLQCVPSGLTH